MTTSVAPPISTQELDALRGLKSDLETLYGERLADVRLYGSRARGEARDDSDFDVAVILHGTVDSDEEIERTMKLVGRASRANEMAICCMFVSLQDYAHPGDFFLRVLREESAGI